MVSTPGDYAWSSFRHNSGSVVDDLITPHPSYMGLGESAPQRQGVYRALVDSGVSEDLVKAIRVSTNGNFVLGDDQFGWEMECALNRQVVPRRPGRPGKSGK